MRISIQSISKSFGGRDLLKDFSLEIHTGTRLAVAGPNGSGKSTFLKMLAGAEGPDSGQVVLPGQTKLGYSAQEFSSLDLETPVLTWVLAALPSWSEFWREWDQASRAHDKAALDRLAAAQARLEHAFGYNPEHKAKVALAGLGFTEAQFAEPLGHLSGGWRERAKLARVLTAGAEILLLDEPTNHLDLEAVEWLESYLADFPGVLVFVAHDRVFLDKVATHVLFLGGSKPVLRPGTFSQFLKWQLETEEQRKREGKRIASEIERKMDFVRRFKAKATKARQAQSQKKQAARLEKELAGVAVETKARTLSFSWPVPARGNKTVLSAVDLELAYQGGKSLWKPLNFQVYARQKIALAGPNGCGKSTLLKAIIRELSPTKGRIEVGPAMKIGYFSQHQADTLSLDKTVISEIRRLTDPRTTEQELMSVLGLFMLGQSFWDRPVAELSGGEKNRLVLASLFLARANFLVLDEPTNHLDLESREALIQALIDYQGAILLVAHDRYVLSQVAEQVWALGPDGIKVFLDGFAGYDKSRSKDADGQGPMSRETRLKPDKEELKKQKRLLAEARNALYRDLKPRQDEYAALELELEKVLAEQEQTEKTLAEPSVYADSARTTDLIKAFHDLSTRSEGLLARMERLEAEIRDIEARR
ncbi:MAG: ABC-F family ATP-binding cassette domain-containing protein [Thermodesulfobacteriota bacterium]|nr:ABC-F family ATP-binding cassette domain-containing protein [Thermodesulfobacteriota bacterium]